MLVRASTPSNGLLVRSRGVEGRGTGFIGRPRLKRAPGMKYRSCNHVR